jgi:hypothetical protein
LRNIVDDRRATERPHLEDGFQGLLSFNKAA